MCLTAKDRHKLTRAGFTIIRTEERNRQVKQVGIFAETQIRTVNHYVIKQSTQERGDWHDRTVCDTKADLDRNLNHLLSDEKVILDE